ncbi:hypothetical protein Ahy_B05g076283 [Arachis hypogaea]|uniref:Serine acetyltransferase N-terminal domain-containing protein n=1 Tax=Arachis hypogaea TaxID=3818 RepID=A0A444Z304_ARAHY|nr:hypothetical protein Ahy_B05g076283 [Arachis hypogaea]
MNHLQQRTLAALNHSPPVAILRPLVSPSSAPVTLQSPSSPSPGSCPVALHLHPLLIFSTPAPQHAVNTGSPPSPSRGPQQSTLSTGSPPSTPVIDLKVRVIICSGTESAVSLPDGKAKLLMFIAMAVFNFIYVLLSSASLPSNTLFDLFVGILKSDQEIMDSVKDNLKAVKERDPACINHVHCFLNFKGFLECQSHRVAHKLWLQGRKVLAVMIQNRVSEIFAIGIHPGAKIGSGILLDHVTGLVVGETAVIGNIVSILHSVTLGGTGKASGDRHPKIGDGVLIGAGTCILGNIK